MGVGIVDLHRDGLLQVASGPTWSCAGMDHDDAIAEPHLGMDDRSIGTGHFDERLETEGLAEPRNLLRAARIAELGKDIGPAGAGAHQMRSKCPEVAVEVAHRVLARSVIGVGRRLDDRCPARSRPRMMRVDVADADIHALTDRRPWPVVKLPNESQRVEAAACETRIGDPKLMISGMYWDGISRRWSGVARRSNQPV